MSSCPNPSFFVFLKIRDENLIFFLENLLGMCSCYWCDPLVQVSSNLDKICSSLIRFYLVTFGSLCPQPESSLRTVRPSGGQSVLWCFQTRELPTDSPSSGSDSLSSGSSRPESSLRTVRPQERTICSLLTFDHGFEHSFIIACRIDLILFALDS